DAPLIPSARGHFMFRIRLALAIGAISTAVMFSAAAQEPAPAGAGRQGAPPAGRRGGGPTPGGAPVGGTLTPKKADERGWGWQVKAMMNPATPRPLYNRAKEALFSRYPPVGRRSSGGGQYNQIWAGLNYRQTINDNMLVTVMIETLEGVAMAEEIAATHGVDVVILGNNDLSAFSGWSQNDPRYQDAIIKVHDAALKYGKYYGNAGAQYLNGYTV